MNPHRGVLRAATLALAVALLAGTGCTHDQGSADEFCRLVRVAPSLESELSSFFDGRSDAARLDAVRTAYRDLAAAAPKAIRGDAKAVRDLVDDVIAAAEAHPGDRTKAADQVRSAMSRHQGVVGSSAALTAYAAERCKVRLDPSVTATTTTSTPTTSTPTPSTPTTTR